MKKILELLILFCAAVFLVGCRDLYRAGSGIQYLRYPIEDRLDPTLIMNYIDTAKAYQVPKEWESFHLLDDLAPEDNKRAYFSDPPREMYLISVGGMTRLSAVFDPNQIQKGGWIGNPDEVSKEEKNRIMNRLAAFLDKIETEAKQQGLPDSVIYFQDPFRHFKK
ncbi:hypothetical protein [Parachryseolinea silvisoli]|jgi:hypothetical protein|uniref:hypothetical protein n=1 Tax=Parachryseolinea silvisoli TaxID=2873601 RepID=UPI002265E81F|nr:hypothetical protein [Parachryseolinea silvisoli]MCD9018263.1 hypothetical protein [Parachryseolinea silvisoli]